VVVEIIGNMLAKLKKQLQQSSEIYLRIKVRPNSAKTEIKEILEDETIKVDVSAVAEKNKANVELIKFLAKEFKVEQGNVAIISGAKERVKLVKITTN